MKPKARVGCDTLPGNRELSRIITNAILQCAIAVHRKGSSRSRVFLSFVTAGRSRSKERSSTRFCRGRAYTSPDL
jgi:hypothetical protein